MDFYIHLLLSSNVYHSNSQAPTHAHAHAHVAGVFGFSFTQFKISGKHNEEIGLENLTHTGHGKSQGRHREIAYILPNEYV